MNKQEWERTIDRIRQLLMHPEDDYLPECELTRTLDKMELEMMGIKPTL